MATDLHGSNLFNPFMLWTDMGMRALDMTLSSSQNIGEGLDRLTRAGATAATADLVENPAGTVASVPQGAAGALPLTSSLQLAAQMQRAAIDMMTQGWQQWMATVGTGLTERSSETARRQRTRANAADWAEHALAKAQPQRRTKAAKPKAKTRSRNR